MNINSCATLFILFLNRTTKQRVSSLFNIFVQMLPTSDYSDWLNWDAHMTLYLFGEVSLEFGYTLTPVGGRLLTDEFDVQEGTLPRTVQVARCLTTDNARGDVRHVVL